MCHANVRLVSGTSAPVISSIAGRTSVPRMSTCRDPNHLTEPDRRRTAVSWMASRERPRSGYPRLELLFAIGTVPLVTGEPHRAHRPEVRVKGQPRFHPNNGTGL